MGRVTAEQWPTLPVVGPDLQQGLLEGPCGQSVENGI